MSKIRFDHYECLSTFAGSKFSKDDSSWDNNIEIVENFVLKKKPRRYFEHHEYRDFLPPHFHRSIIRMIRISEYGTRQRKSSTDITFWTKNF